MKRLESLISELRNNNAMHVKRGYRMKDVTLTHQTNAMLEEAVELQAEILDGVYKDYILKEASHVISVFTHLMIRCGITMEQVEDRAISEVRTHFTFDPNKTTAKEVGFNRSVRAEPKESDSETNHVTRTETAIGESSGIKKNSVAEIGTIVDSTSIDCTKGKPIHAIDRPNIGAKQCPVCEVNHDSRVFHATKPFNCKCGAILE